MTADVDHLGHDALTDVVGLLWVVSYVEIHRVMYQTIGDAFLLRLGRASPLALEPSTQHRSCALSSGWGHHEGDVWHSGGSKWEEEEREVMIPTKQKNAHQTMMAVAAVLHLTTAVGPHS